MNTIIELDEKLKKVAVIGAAGKMGSGIALLLLQEMAQTSVKKHGNVNSALYQLVLIDANPESLPALKSYLRSNLIKYAEKNINGLRKFYEKNESLVSNEEIIQAFVQTALDITLIGTEVVLAKDSRLIFEAILEDFEVKSTLFRTLQQMNSSDSWYFTNTSSIPIQKLAASAGINSRLIGFHFYNPPAVQKLLEMVIPKSTDPQLINAGKELAARLQKNLVTANDIAGFIGNGHFIREVLFALKETERLSDQYKIPFHEAVFIINSVTERYLLRPMGIFQLIDYVGLDVCLNIMHIMSTYHHDIHSENPILHKMVALGIKGGHDPNGMQKNGFFSYHKHELEKIYSLTKKEYEPLPDLLAIEGLMGGFSSPISWKSLQNDPQREKQIEEYFKKLSQMQTAGARLAQRFLTHSEKVIEELVSSGVAQNRADVITVLKQGFFHV